MYYTVLNGIGQVLAVDPTRRGMVGALNSAYLRLEHEGNLGYAVGFMGDDHRPRTRGWDTRYLETLRGLGTGFVYGDDLYQHEAIATQCAFTRDIPLALGYMCPPEFDHLCVDVVWNDWGKTLDRIVYLPDVVVEHMHYLAGKSNMDKGYALVNSGQMAAHDSAAYRSYHDSGRFQEDIDKLMMLLPKKRAKRGT